MIKNILLFAFSLLILASCAESQDEKEDKLILNYLDENGIEAVSHESGLYYQIINEGDGANPTVNNEVSVTYKGYMLNGIVFDQTAVDEVRKFALSGLIEGWQIGIPLIKEGGSIVLFLPSRLGYGEQQAGVIPANSVLVFEITLIDAHF